MVAQTKWYNIRAFNLLKRTLNITLAKNTLLKKTKVKNAGVK